MHLILASSSPHRRELLARLRLAFEAIAPNVDETPRPNESPAALVERLSLAKARAVAAQHPDAVVIGSDQVAAIAAAPQPDTLGKPKDRSAAIAQLRRLSGRRIQFLTGLCVMAPTAPPDLAIETTDVVFRHLTDSEIATYIDREQPFGCAASFRSERLGIALVESIRGDDPNALIGLPLIRLCDMLARAGVDLL